jgi:hypothetical protein
MILSPLQEYGANHYREKTSSSPREYVPEPPLQQKNAEKNFGGLAVFQSLRIRLEDP